MPDHSSNLRHMADGSARLATVLASFALAVFLSVGPIIWVLGTLNGYDVTIDGGIGRLLAQLAAVGLLARTASRRSRGLPVFRPNAHG